MADTYTLIERISVGAAGASSVTFTSIPQTYTDLKIVYSARAASGTTNDVYIKLNASTTSYSRRVLYGNGTIAQSANDSGNWYLAVMGAANNTSSTFSSGEIYIPNYTSSNNKSASADGVNENNATLSYQFMVAGLWSNTAAITSIEVVPDGVNFAQYSTFYLYGIAKEGVSPAPSSAPYATGGDSILFDGTYWIHTFTSSGTFTPKKGLTCDYLVVAGGGGASNGGGGAGGFRSTVTATGGGGSLESALSLAANTGYTVTVGGGGASAAQGSNSVFSTITSTGGGAGGSGTGGSGGGANAAVTASGGTGTANQGYNGGANTGYSNVSAGGGGAGAAGSAPSSSNVSGNGGNGVATSITGSSVTRAGGGGGGSNTGSTPGSGGTGGGGNAGAGSNAGANGTVNTGGGGGGSFFGTVGTGGSGIVIVRYAA